MSQRKNIILDTKKKQRILPLLLMLFFTLSFILISNIAERFDNMGLHSIPNKNGIKAVFHKEGVEDINILLDDGWYFVPNVTCASYEAGDYRFTQLYNYAYYENVSISKEYGWNDLGKDSSLVNIYGNPDLTPVEGTHFVSAMYMTRIVLVPNTDTIYLHLDEINGHGKVYCNGREVGAIDGGDKIKLDISHSSKSYPVRSNSNSILDICIIVESDSRIANPGMTVSPSLTSNNDESKFLVAGSIWFSYQLIIFFTCLLGGFILVRTFANRQNLYIAFALESLYLVYTAIDNRFVMVPLIAKAIICQSIIVALIVLSYGFISYLFNTKENTEKHKILKYDFIIVSLIGILILVMEFTLRKVTAGLYPAVSTLTLMTFTVIASVIKICFVYEPSKNTSIAFIFIAAYMHTIIYMINRSTTLLGIKMYTIYFVILFFVILFIYTRSYVKQYNELSNISTRLQYLLKEKTQHISEINKDLYATNKKLLENEEARKNVLSNVSHDLRTPITAIRGYAELILSSGANMKPEQVNNYLGNIVKRSNQIERIVSDIVELTRMESSANEFQFMDVSMAELLDELYMMYESDIRDTQKKMEIDLPDTDLLMVKADPKKISRVFENLISNAINYTYDEALIKIRGYREGADLPVSEQKVHIIISDNGIGIPQEELDKVFDRFYRAKNSGKNIKGTGLGLSIVKTILDHHDASITVNSTLGSGTEFHIVMNATY